MTALYGIEAAVPNVEDKEELNVHLVGVRRAELRHLIGWEILACRLPKLKRLRLHFIGDEATVGDFPKEFSYKGRDLQSERPNVEVKYFFPKPVLYQVERDWFFSLSAILSESIPLWKILCTYQNG